MKEDDKLTDAIIDLGTGMKELRDEMKGMRKEQHETNQRLEKLELQQAKTNVQLAEHSRAILKLADRQDEHNTRLGDNSSAVRSLTAKMVMSANLEKRVQRLERMMLK